MLLEWALFFASPATVAPSAPAVPSAMPAAAVSAPVAPPTAPVESLKKEVVVERWGGRQTVIGSRKLPVLGTFEMRTDIWVMAEVRQDGQRWDVEQTTCRVEVGDVAAVSVRFPEAALPRIPSVSFSVVRDADGILSVAPWRSGWDATDFDRDGWGGLTLIVDAPMCHGKLAVVSDSMTSGRVRVATREALELDLEVRVGQHILDYEGWCLRFADEQTDDRFVGRARYAPLAPGATCADVVALPPALPRD